jgi:serine phosphatase RsbU (regulator of sigma subunit)
MPASALGRLLIVDDEIDLMTSLRRILAKQGYEVVGFTSGGEALAALQQEEFDLLLIDLKMPEMDGVVLLRAALERQPDLVGIMMTGQGTIQTAVETMKAGAFDYILKPFRLAALAPVLARAMQVRQLRQRTRQLAQENLALTSQLEAELARAGQVQAEFLPRDVPRLPGFELAARCIPAREVGGDFYDWYESAPGVVSLTLGDVMGKGMPAALLMATVRASLRAVAFQNPPAAALELVRRALDADLERTSSFVTLFYAQLDVTSRRLSYVDAGHGHVFIRRGRGEIDSLQRGGPPVGVVPGPGYQEGATTLEPGDCLVVYSDGLVDARPQAPLNRQALAERLPGAPSAAAMVERLVALAAPTGPPPDDLTVVVLRCSTEPTVP